MLYGKQADTADLTHQRATIPKSQITALPIQILDQVSRGLKSNKISLR